MPIISGKSGDWKRLALIVAGFALTVCVALPVLANGIPEPAGLNLQDPGSPLEERIHSFHDILLWIISFICVFVLGLMVYVMVRFNKWTNPRPSMTTHNVTLEIVWTLVPCLILIGIALISFPLLYYADRAPGKVDMTLKVTGHQWYWSYEYPDHGNLAFDSHAIWDSSDVTKEDAAKLIKEFSPGWIIKGEPRRMLEVDNRLVLPVGATVRVQITGADVEHSWFVPSLAVNQMSVPGRLNEVWLKINKEGIYYGQCSMICGNGHAYMPIVIEGVSPERFAEWIERKKASASLEVPATTQLAQGQN